MQPPEIRIDRLEHTVWLVTLTGEHDMATAPQLQEALAEIERHGTDVIVDLSGTTFVDSTIVGVLVQHNGDGERISVVAPPGGVPRRVLDIVRLDPVVSVHDTREAALRAMQGG